MLIYQAGQQRVAASMLILTLLFSLKCKLTHDNSRTLVLTTNTDLMLSLIHRKVIKGANIFGAKIPDSQQLIEHVLCGLVRLPPCL